MSHIYSSPNKFNLKWLLTVQVGNAILAESKPEKSNTRVETYNDKPRILADS